MKITFTIELGNDASQSPNDVAKILQEWIRRFSGGDTGGQFAFTKSEISDTAGGSPLRDANGNKVGTWQVVE